MYTTLIIGVSILVLIIFIILICTIIKLKRDKKKLNNKIKELEQKKDA